MLKLVDGEIERVGSHSAAALDRRLRDDYSNDCVKGVERWNKVIAKTSVDFQLALPHMAFNRESGDSASPCDARG